MVITDRITSAVLSAGCIRCFLAGSHGAHGRTSSVEVLDTRHLVHLQVVVQAEHNDRYDCHLSQLPVSPSELHAHPCLAELSDGAEHAPHCPLENGFFVPLPIGVEPVPRSLVLVRVGDVADQHTCPLHVALGGPDDTERCVHQGERLPAIAVHLIAPRPA